jgi:hypothetical protein
MCLRKRVNLKAPEPARARAYPEDHRDLPEPDGGGSLLTPGGDGRDREERLQPEYFTLHQHGGGRGGDRSTGDSGGIGDAGPADRRGA